MSLSLRNKLTVVLAADGMTISLRKKGWRSPLEELGSLAVEPGNTSQAWDAVLTALGQWLAQSTWTSADAEVVVSDAFARYVLFPWPQDSTKRAEIAALARIHFDVLFGATDREMEISWHLAEYGKDGIACALQRSFLESLKAVFAKNKVHLVSVETGFVRTFNTWRSRVAGNGLLVRVENGLCVMAAIRDGLWKSIRSVKLSGDMPSSLLAAIDREIVLQGENERTRVYLDLHTLVDTSTFAQMERFHVLGRGLYGARQRKIEVTEAAG
ncbi:hypothetical protein [Herbaspirillum sp. RV1423]|uniref:hypothetical protein n=1 Tax=Herbaspirillum sp. RV1423 TaxID=1443993 RepID=UPI0012DBFFAB|nr:hypothetical protein [Herbaspirillum sp. RV1423]